MTIVNRLKNKWKWIKYNKYRKNLNALDKNLTIYGDFIVKNPEKIKVGSNCRINENVFLHGGGGIEIKDDVTLSAFSKIISYGYNTENWPANYIHKQHVANVVFIGKGTWLGAGAIVLPGVKITGEGVIIAAGAVLTKNIDEDFVVFGGNPAKKIKDYKIAPLCKK